MEGLEVVGEEHDLLKLIRRETKGEELEDTVKQAVKALKSTLAHSIHSSEWSEAEGVLYSAVRSTSRPPLTSNGKSWRSTMIVTSLGIPEGGRL